MKTKTQESIEWVINNITKIPSKFWSETENNYIVIWLLDREDGTAGSCETSQERLGVTIEREILWGFSSGCSCWEGWSKEDYAKTITYKEFVIKDILEIVGGRYNLKEDSLAFSQGWEEEVIKKVDEIMGDKLI